MNAVTQAREMTPTVDRGDAASALASVILRGDLSKLTEAELVTHYNATCQSLDLNPLTRPFEYLTLNGKKVLYARKDCTDQLRAKRRVSVHVVRQEIDAGLVMVTARATLPDGRQDEDFGAVPLPASGEARANALMKAMTKAKRRVTLSICGLGFLDESELDGLPPQALRDVPNQEVQAPALAAPTVAAMQDGADKPLPIYAPDGVLHHIGPGAGQPAVMRWMSAARKALLKLEDAEAVRGWNAAMAPHLAEIATAEPEAVDAVHNLVSARLEALTPDSEPETESEQ